MTEPVSNEQAWGEGPDPAKEVEEKTSSEDALQALQAANEARFSNLDKRMEDTSAAFRLESTKRAEAEARANQAEAYARQMREQAAVRERPEVQPARLPTDFDPETFQDNPSKALEDLTQQSNRYVDSRVGRVEEGLKGVQQYAPVVQAMSSAQFEVAKKGCHDRCKDMGWGSDEELRKEFEDTMADIRLGGQEPTLIFNPDHLYEAVLLRRARKGLETGRIVAPTPPKTPGIKTSTSSEVDPDELVLDGEAAKRLEDTFRIKAKDLDMKDPDQRARVRQLLATQ